MGFSCVLIGDNMTKNINRVPKKSWMQWSELARKVFNRVYNFVMDNEDLMKHPKQPVMKPRHWKTIAWNSAWIAADAVDDKVPDEIETVR
jgi:hypothetical protein